jgi:hypothetical protein
MSLKKRAKHAAAARWKDPEQRREAAVLARARMSAVWALAKAAALLVEKGKKAA